MLDQFTQRRERQITRATRAVRRQYPGWTATESVTRNLVAAVLDAGDDEPDPQRDWSVEAVGRAGLFVQALIDNDPDSMEVQLARRNLQEWFLRAEKVEMWDLVDAEGRSMGQLRGTRRDYERAQAALRPDPVEAASGQLG